MQSPTGPSRGLVVAAVCFDPQTDAVVKAATTLARRFDMEVRFVHVVEPIMMEPWVATMSPYYSYYPIDAEVEAESLKAKDAKLKELMAGIKPAVRMSATVISGMAGQALVAECIAKRANLLVTAYSPESYRLSNAGLSTALNLMHEAPLPVLAVTAGSAPDFSKVGFRILVADDLQEATSQAVRKAYELAAGLEQSHLRHVNVHGDFRELIKGTWSDLRDKLAHKHAGDLSPEELWTADQKARLAKMHEQAAPFNVKAEQAKVKIEIDIRSSTRVADELYDVAAKADPDLLVLGATGSSRPAPS